jgi:hypothetical protein
VEKVIELPQSSLKKGKGRIPAPTLVLALNPRQAKRNTSCPRLSTFWDFCNEKLMASQKVHLRRLAATLSLRRTRGCASFCQLLLILAEKLCYIDCMKWKSFFPGVFFWAILWGLCSCGTVQIKSDKKPAPEPTREEKPAPEKATPKGHPAPEAPKEKGFLGKIFQKIAPSDTFSRTYPIEFSSFHPRANSALQDYARTRKGNSFQISRLGSNEVVLRGIYIREGTQERYAATLTARPAGIKQSQLEIKVNPATETNSSGNPEAAAQEIFLIIEKSLGTRAP